MNLHADWNAVLAHELRSPLAAILGYQELLDDGTFGELPPAAEDALRRMRYAATQLLTLIDAAEGGDDADEPSTVMARDFIDSAVTTVRFEADARATHIVTPETAIQLSTRITDACRALALMLGAAIKATPGGTLRCNVDDDDTPRITVSGTGLDPVRDRLDPNRPLTGAGLRLELASAAARRVRGSVELRVDGALELVLPRLPT
jgi:two-component system, NtrC family, sensor kinase